MPIILAQAAPPAAVAPAPPKLSVVTKPDWLRKPTGDDFSDVYPKGAVAKHVEGRAVIHCRVNELGDLADCKVTAEDPVGEGFGDSALAMAPKFKMRPQTKGGLSVSGGQINIPLVFRLPPASVRISPLVVTGKRGQPDPASPPNPPGALEYYPAAARARGLAGDVLLRCVVQPDGRLDGCAVIEETPPGEGFGAKAQFLSTLMKIKPQQEGRLPAPRETSILFPVQFRMSRR